jgi:hypothetical protein
MTAAFPQIRICDGIEVIEVDETIRGAVHHYERDQTAFHGPTLIHAFCVASSGQDSAFGPISFSSLPQWLVAVELKGTRFQPAYLGTLGGSLDTMST